MKNSTLLIALFAIFALPAFSQQKLAGEEAAIKKVIEDETMYFFQRNFDKWAECVAHDDMAYFSYTSPFHGEQALMEAHGWEEISKFTKEVMEKWPANENIPDKTDYKFKVAGNMAYVTFTENGSLAETRVLEKKDGQWRILRMEATNSGAFEKFHQLYALHRMAGTWEIDLATFKKSAGDWTLVSTVMEIERTPTGLAHTEHSTYRNDQGDLRVYEEQGMMSVNMNTGVIGAFSAPHYPYSGWTEAAYGSGKFDEEGVLHIKGGGVGDAENVAEVKFWLEGDNLNFWQEVKNQKGEMVYASSYQMHRKGAAARP